MRELIEVLGLLVTADQTVDEAQGWTLYYTMGGPVLPGAKGWPDAAAAPSTAEVDEMADQDWVRITAWPSDKGRHFTVTGKGRRVWQEHEQDIASPPADHRPAALDWETSRELLRGIYDVYVERGAPRRGIDALALISQHPDPNSARAQLDELIRGGYVDRAIDRPGRVRLVRPCTRTLEMFAGWPSTTAEDTLARLVEALTTEIDNTSDEDKRTRLVRVRDGLLGAAQDIALKVLEKKIEGTL
jgi:hypothetical protein